MLKIKLPSSQRWTCFYITLLLSREFFSHCETKINRYTVYSLRNNRIENRLMPSWSRQVIIKRKNESKKESSDDDRSKEKDKRDCNHR